MQREKCGIPMEIDMADFVSIMSEGTHQSTWPIKGFDVSDIKLQTYSREPLPVDVTKAKIEVDPPSHPWF